MLFSLFFQAFLRNRQPLKRYTWNIFYPPTLRFWFGSQRGNSSSSCNSVRFPSDWKWYRYTLFVCFFCRYGLGSTCLAMTSVSTLATRSPSVVGYSSSLKPFKLFLQWTRLRCLACILTQISRESVSLVYSPR